MPSWTFNSKKALYCVRNISVFLNCCCSLTEKNWKVLRKCHGRVAKTAFYVSRGTIFWKTNCFFGKIVLFSVFDCQGKIVTPAKGFSEGCLKNTLWVQLIAFTMKTFFAMFYLLHLFRTSSGKCFQLSTYLFCKAVSVHSTYSDEHFLEKKVFFGKDYKFSSILDMETKIIREFLEFFRKQCLHWIIKCPRERYYWFFFL